jgi:Flp pilus assembly protein CpaB
LATAPAPARPRPGGGRLFIIVGLLLALLAGAGVFFLPGLLGTNNGGGIQGGNQTVVVAKQNINARHTITSADLTTASAAGSFISVNAYTRPSDVVNLISEINIKQGSIITSDMLARDLGVINASSGPAYLPLASGYVAMTIPTSEQQGVANYIQPEDYISVIATVSTAGKVASKTIFTNVHVIRVGMQVGAGSNATTASSLTVVVTECQAEVITWFLNYAALKYVLESFKDYLQPGTVAPDPKCPTVGDAKGVTLPFIQTVYPTLF